MSELEAKCRHLLAEAGVPGMAVAVIRDGRFRQTLGCGVRGVRSPVPVDEDTVFDAASLSKPVFAHAVLQLVDEGRFSLDAPLGDYLPGYLPGDGWASAITARHVLSHGAGLPNWRGADRPLKAYFRPGERFSYSGEGFLYLQRAVEAVTGERLHDLADRLVLQPFGMARSSFVWEWRFEPNRAHPHDDFGYPAVGWKPGEGNAASTLQTTAADYGRFLLHVLAGSRLRPEIARLWLRPEIQVRHAKPQALGPVTEDVATGVAWGLGWGLEPHEGTFFHWGNNGAFKAFVVGSARRGDAAVFFMNGASGLSIVPDLLAGIIPGDRPSLAWLGYGRHDSPARRLLRAAVAQGIASVREGIEAAEFGADDLSWIAQGLTAAGRDGDASWLRKQVQARKAADAERHP